MINGKKADKFVTGLERALQQRQGKTGFFREEINGVTCVVHYWAGKLTKAYSPELWDSFLSEPAPGEKQ